MIWFGALGCGLAVVLAVAVVAMERQMRAVARMLASRGRSLRRVTLPFPTPAARELAQAANGLIEEADATRLAAAEERRALQENLAAFSHDVRTPLAGAQGYLQLYGVAESAAERDECVEAAAERLTVMRGLVDALFEYAKADDGSRELACEPVDVGAVVAEGLAALYPAFTERGWEPAVSLAEGVMAEADSEALARIVENLLGNCLRHGSAAPVVELRCEAAGEFGGARSCGKPRGGDLLVAHGPDAVGASRQLESAPGSGRPGGRPYDNDPAGRCGEAFAGGSFALVISNEAVDVAGLDGARLFDRFYRGDASRRAGGSGLGLAIAAALANRMGMELSVDLTDTQFAIALTGPLAESAAT